jgi:hypothetical protein
MAPEPGKPRDRLSKGERRLAIAGAALFAVILVVSLGLWVRHGEEIFFSRIVTSIANCF